MKAKNNSCNKPCSPSDFYVGGYCDKNGCLDNWKRSVKKRPLAGNHVARELKKIFRLAQIKYIICNYSIIADSNRFPPLVFEFRDNYVNVYNKNDLRVGFSFPCTTITQLFVKLLKYRLINDRNIDFN